MRRLALLLLSSTALFGCDDYLLPEAEIEADRVDTILALTGAPGSGETVFDQHCEVCHVKAGDAASAGPALGTLIPTLEDAVVIRVILEGQGTMPAVSLEDQETADVLAWLKATFDGGDTGDTADTADTDRDTDDSDTDS